MKNIQYQSGFLTLEALIACTLLAMIVPAALLLSWSANSLEASARSELISLATSSKIISDGAASVASSSADQYYSKLGSTICTVSPIDQIGGQGNGFASVDSYPNLTLPLVSSSTSIRGASLTARNGFIYVALDSSIQSQADFFIIDARIPDTPSIVSSISTGPGLAAVTVAGHYAYTANKSSLSQLQVIDISDRANPIIVASLKLPLPTATTTAPHASSIFFSQGLIYLGTEKWNGAELNIIDVTKPLFPTYLGGFDTGSLVNDIYVKNAYAYVADADSHQMRVLDVHDPQNIREISYFSPAGSLVLEGKALAVSLASTTTLYLGRTGGGFNNTSDHELFSFDISSLAASSTHSHDIPGGVYGIGSNGSLIYIGTHDSAAAIQAWSVDLSNRINFPSITNMPSLIAPGMSTFICDHDRFYPSFPNNQGFGVIIPR